MPPLTSRRGFLTSAGKAGLGLYISTTISAKGAAIGAERFRLHPVGFQQTPLPYSYDALTDAIDATTMEIHYTKHAAAYAANLQNAARKEGIDMSMPLEDVLRRVSKYTPTVRNNGGGHYNHELYWQIMSAKSSGRPSGRLANALNDSFGSFETFQSQFADAGKNRFGSGWAWLYIDGDKKLRIGSTPNQDNPLMDVSEIKGLPLMGLDVWEHAYYLRYQNKRADYINNWWKVVNWDYIQNRYQSLV